MNHFKGFLVFILSLTAILVSAQKNQGYDIKFKINNFNGKSALLAYHFGDKQYILDTLEKNTSGYFQFKGDTTIRGGLYLFVLPPKNNYFEFIIDNKESQSFTLETDSADLINKMKVTTSKQNELFFGDIRFISEKRKLADDLQKKIKDAGTDSVQIKKHQASLKGIDNEVISAREKLVKENPGMLYSAILKATKDPEIPETPKDKDGKPVDSLFAYKYYKSHFWDNINFTDDRILLTPVFIGKINQYLDKVCSQANDSLIKETEWLISRTRGNKEMFKYMVVTTLNKYANDKIMGHDAVYVSIAENYYCSGLALAWTDSAQCTKICDRAIKLSPTILGRRAPEVRIMDENDKWVSLSDITSDYTVLYFWDYDCGHCKKVTPKLMQVANAYLDKGANVKFYTVEINGTRDEWKKKLKDYKMTREGVINTADPSRVTGFDKKYDLLSTPRIVILDKDKKIIAKYISSKQMDEILNHYIYGKNEPMVIFEEDTEPTDGGDKH